MDADAFAMNRSLELIENLITVKDKKVIDSSNGVKYLYKSMMFAIYSFYLFFDETLDIQSVSKKNIL